MATINNFVGENTRSLASLMNEKNSDIDFVKNSKNGHIFAVLQSTGEALTCSEAVQQKIASEGIGTLADYNVCDMPSKDATTGLPNGGHFVLITLRSKNNVIGSLTR